MNRDKAAHIAAVMRGFARMLEDVPEDNRDYVRGPFCDAIGRYFEVTEGTDGKNHGMGQKDDGE